MKPTFVIDGTWYHGGKKADILKIAANNIDTTVGGGELGVGFYVGDYGHIASAWARHKNRHDAVVAELTIANFSASGLVKLDLSRLSAVEHCIKIRKAGKQKIFAFARDVVAAQIVGKIFKEIPPPVQLKWEGSSSETYLNSFVVNKRVTKL